MLKKLFPVVFLSIISVIAIIPLFHQGFIPIHDDTQVARVYEMSVALRDGLFPVRWVPDLGYGYGYPIFNFYAPLAYYIGGIFVLAGLPALTATKMMMGLGMVLASVFMYLLARRFMKEQGAVLAALLYIFAPYHAVNLYVRGAIAELWAYAFIPLAFYGLVRLYQKVTWGSVIVTAIGLAGVLLSHNLTAFMLVPFYGIILFVLLFSAYQKKKTIHIQYLLLAVLVGVLLSAFYWLPALAEMHYTNVSSQITGGSQYKDHYVCLEQLWAGVWGYGGSTAGCLDGLSFQIGKIHLFLAAVSLFTLGIFFKKTKILLPLLLGGIFSFFMVLPISKFVWDSVPQMAFLQFPWRYLQFIVYFFSLAGGYTVNFYSERYLPKKVFISWGVILIILGGIFLLYYKNFTPQQYLTDYRDETKKEVITWTVSKISDEYLPKGILKPKNPQAIPNSIIEGRVSNVSILKNNTQYLQAQVTTTDETLITINKAAFPAWQISVNQTLVTPTVKKGIYQITLPKGTSVVEMKFIQTPVEKLGNTLSLIGVSIVILGIMMRGKINKHAKAS